MSATNSFEPVITVTGVAGGTIDYEMRPALSKEQLDKAVSRLLADAARTQIESVSCESGRRQGRRDRALRGGRGRAPRRRTVEVNRVEGLMMNFDVVPLLIKEEVAS
jgi:hypothetical protein